MKKMKKMKKINWMVCFLSICHIANAQEQANPIDGGSSFQNNNPFINSNSGDLTCGDKSYTYDPISKDLITTEIVNGQTQESTKKINEYAWKHFASQCEDLPKEESIDEERLSLFNGTIKSLETTKKNAEKQKSTLTKQFYDQQFGFLTLLHSHHILNIAIGRGNSLISRVNFLISAYKVAHQKRIGITRAILNPYSTEATIEWLIKDEENYVNTNETLYHSLMKIDSDFWDFIENASNQAVEALGPLFELEKQLMDDIKLITFTFDLATKLTKSFAKNSSNVFKRISNDPKLRELINYIISNPQVISKVIKVIDNQSGLASRIIPDKIARLEENVNKFRTQIAILNIGSLFIDPENFFEEDNLNLLQTLVDLNDYNYITMLNNFTDENYIKLLEYIEKTDGFLDAFTMLNIFK